MVKRDFTVGEVFELVFPSGELSSRELVEGNDVPYVASRKANNGVRKMCSIENIPPDQVMRGNCIVFVQRGNGSAGCVTYQPNDFYATPSVCCGYIDGVLDENVGLYLMAILDKNKRLYGYENAWTGSRLENTPIPLPVKVDAAGEPVEFDGGYVPDWDSVRSYIEGIKLESYRRVLERIARELGR